MRVMRWDYESEQVSRLLSCYLQLTGRNLLGRDLPPLAAARELYFAPFAVLSHDGAEDPVFTYANLTAQILFAMPWRTIIGLPSRYSAEPLLREERQRFLDTVSRQGFIDDYQGIRMGADGSRFEIARATVWNLWDVSDQSVGQAACFSEWTLLAAFREETGAL